MPRIGRGNRRGSRHCCARPSMPEQFGFSTTDAELSISGYQARPLACRNASRGELTAYCQALKEAGKGAIEIALTQKVSVLNDEERGTPGIAAGRERPPGDVSCPVPPHRSARRVRRNAPARRPAPGRGWADLALRVDARHQYAEPVLLCRLQMLGPGVRRQIGRGAARGLRRSVHFATPSARNWKPPPASPAIGVGSPYTKSPGGN